MQKFVLLLATALLVSSPAQSARRGQDDPRVNEVLQWNQIFIDALIKSGTPNSSSQRLGAIVHTAVFDAYNGIERRYTPIFVQEEATPGASRRAAVITAAYTALHALFQTADRRLEFDTAYAAALAALSDDGEDGGVSRERGIEWGIEVANSVLAWRATDGFTTSYPAFTGGTAIGQWRPTSPATPPICAAMSAQSLAFTETFVVPSRMEFRAGPPRTLTSATYTSDFNAVKALGRRTGVRHVRTTRLLLRRSGNTTQACIGIRPQTRSRRRTT